MHPIGSVGKVMSSLGIAIPANALVIDNATAPASDGDAIVLDNATADEGAFIIIDDAT